MIKIKTVCNCENVSKFDLLEPEFAEYTEGGLIAVLQKAQNIYGYLSGELLLHISRRLGIKMSGIMGVVTFYAQFKTKPAGKHLILLCRGTACHVNGSADIEDSIKNHLNVKEGEMTKDGLFTYENAACLGCCSLSPVMMVGDKTYGNLTGESAVRILEEIRNYP